PRHDLPRFRWRAGAVSVVIAPRRRPPRHQRQRQRRRLIATLFERRSLRLSRSLAPSPRSSRGEGGVRGCFHEYLMRGESPSPEAFGLDLSPQAGRGDRSARPYFPSPAAVTGRTGSPSRKSEPARATTISPSFTPSR